MKRIPLTQGQYAIVDDEDYPTLIRYKWYAAKGKTTYYARRSIWDGKKNIFILMHRQILNASKGMDVDHKDCNGLDNRRHNIRICTRSQHHFNRRSRPNSSSKYKGVNWDKKLKKWRASLRINSKIFISLGYYFEEKKAALAYNKKAKELRGDYARLNNV